MSIKNEVMRYSKLLGNDSMLVQGAGGNVSWKEGDILWIKASGTWLADAENSEIFMPLSLVKIRQLIDEGVSDFTSACLPSYLRPSIETSLHALLPHTIVVHVHAVEVIARAVVDNAGAYLEKLLAGLNWTWVDYVTPGLDLTIKIREIIANKSFPDVIILGNHGLVVAGESVEQVDALLRSVLIRCKTEPRFLHNASKENLDGLGAEWEGTGYCLPNNSYYHALSFDAISLILARHKWVMYPDHAIFLGGYATFKNNQLPREFVASLTNHPPFIIIESRGIVVSEGLSPGQNAMIRCYLDVTSRLSNPKNVVSLSEEQINKLLGWDAEQYRQMINIPN